MRLPSLSVPAPQDDPEPRPLTFTPAEWRWLLEDPGFLDDEDNSYRVPRRLMGLPVQIVPDHSRWF